MDISEMYNVLDSFVPGFGKRNNPDTNNAVFIANELFNLGLTLKWRGAGRQGIQSLKLYGIDQTPLSSQLYKWHETASINLA